MVKLADSVSSLLWSSTYLYNYIYRQEHTINFHIHRMIMLCIDKVPHSQNDYVMHRKGKS